MSEPQPAAPEPAPAEGAPPAPGTPEPASTIPAAPAAARKPFAIVPPPPRPKYRLFSPLGKNLAGCGCLSFLLLGMGFLFPFQAAFALAFGWIAFAGRVLPNVGVSPVALATAAVYLGAFAVGVRVLAPPLLRAMGGSAAALGARFGAGHTALALVLLGALFASGIAAVGAAHQVAWLARSRRPLFTSAYHSSPRVMLLQAFRGLESSMKGGSLHAEEVRAALGRVRPQRDQELFETHDLLLRERAGGTIEAVLLLPRDPGERDHWGVIFFGEKLDLFAAARSGAALTAWREAKSPEDLAIRAAKLTD